MESATEELARQILKDRKREAYKKMLHDMNERKGNKLDVQALLDKMAERIDTDRCGTPVGK